MPQLAQYLAGPLLVGSLASLHAQTEPAGAGGQLLQSQAVQATPATSTVQGSQPARAQEIQELRAELNRISARLAVLEAADSATAKLPAPVPQPGTSAPALPVAAETTATLAAASPGVVTPPVPRAVVVVPTLSAEDQATLKFFRGTTLNFGVDGYYGYNFNEPIGRVNLLRAYDVSSNSFSLNQVDVIVERLPTTQARLGGRIDLQWGQATETLQGSGVNEQRPQVWRNLYQAYGSYLAPVGKGLRFDFGKWSSSLGNEGNYTKDQIAYSRGYLFNYLPFYHMGLRANYDLTRKVNVGYWLVNGAQQTEDFNGAKSQAIILTLKPASTVTWNVNYYFGQEARDVQPTLNPGIPTSPTQPGLPTTNINPAPNGREHIFDTYATWQATKHLQLVGEADFVVNRTYAEQQPGRVVIGAVEGQYGFAHKWTVGGRGEYFDDRGGLFSGSTQALKEGTAVLSRRISSGFLVKAEYRRDWSNQRFFLTDTVGSLVHAQSTATLGLIYWWGMKTGNW